MAATAIACGVGYTLWNGGARYLWDCYWSNQLVIPEKVDKFTAAAMNAMDVAGDDYIDPEEEAELKKAEAAREAAEMKSKAATAVPVTGVPVGGSTALMFGSIDSGVTMEEVGVPVVSVARPTTSPDTTPPEPAKKKRKADHITVRVALEIKAKLGLLKRTEANMLLLQRAGRKIMEEWLMRPSHIATFLPIAVELALIPSCTDIAAVQMRATHEALRRDREVRGTWLSFTKYFDPSQLWWCRSRGLTVVPK